MIGGLELHVPNANKLKEETRPSDRVTQSLRKLQVSTRDTSHHSRGVLPADGLHRRCHFKFLRSSLHSQGLNPPHLSLKKVKSTRWSFSFYHFGWGRPPWGDGRSIHQILRKQGHVHLEPVCGSRHTSNLGCQKTCCIKMNLTSSPTYSASFWIGESDSATVLAKIWFGSRILQIILAFFI